MGSPSKVRGPSFSRGDTCHHPDIDAHHLPQLTTGPSTPGLFPPFGAPCAFRPPFPSGRYGFPASTVCGALQLPPRGRRHQQEGLRELGRKNTQNKKVIETRFVLLWVSCSSADMPLCCPASGSPPRPPKLFLASTPSCPLPYPSLRVVFPVSAGEAAILKPVIRRRSYIIELKLCFQKLEPS